MPGGGNPDPTTDGGCGKSAASYVAGCLLCWRSFGLGGRSELDCRRSRGPIDECCVDSGPRSCVLESRTRWVTLEDAAKCSWSSKCHSAYILPRPIQGPTWSLVVLWVWQSKKILSQIRMPEKRTVSHCNRKEATSMRSKKPEDLTMRCQPWSHSKSKTGPGSCQAHMDK